MATPVRPLSPHLDIYRWQISNTLSIMHRLSGVFLGLGFVLLCTWLVALAGGSETYAGVLAILRGPLGIAVLTGWTAAFFFHFLNGVRHLFWDAGIGFDKRHSHLTGWLSLAGTVVLTAAVMIWVLK